MPESGQRLAEAVARLLETSSEPVALDFSDVYRMTPSFANAFVMLLLDRVPIATVKKRVSILHRQPNVVEAMNKAADRYRRGIRLALQSCA